MGTATIISGGEAGKYTVTPGRDKGIDRQAATEAMLEEIEGQIVEAEADLQSKLDALESAAEALGVIVASIRDGIAEKSAAAPLVKAYQTAEVAVTKSRAVLADLKYNLTAEKTRVDAALGPESKEIWCADLTEDLAGEVGTAEVNGVPGHEIIMPGGGEGLGTVQPATVSTAAAVMYNWALLPAWQRHKPTHRIGTLTAVDYEAGTCSLTLDAASASLVVDEDGDLGTSAAVSINPENLDLTAVPITYMTCNAEAFKPGDSVLVRFIDQDWSKPEVVGFESNPQPCGTVIPVEIYGPAGDSDFVTFANARISDLDDELAHAAYMKNTFIPEILAHYGSLEGKCVVFFYGIPWNAVSQADVDK